MKLRTRIAYAGGPPRPVAADLEGTTMTNPYASSETDDQHWAQRPATGAPTHTDGIPPGGDPAQRPASTQQPASQQSMPQQSVPQRSMPQRPPTPAPRWDPAPALTWESWDPEPVPMWEPALAPWTGDPAPQWTSAPPVQSGPTDQSSATPAGQGPADPSRRDAAPRRWRPSLAVRIAVPAAALVVLAAVLGFAWPGFLHAKAFGATTFGATTLDAKAFGTKAFGAATLETGVTAVLRDSYQIDATDVTCPAGQPVRAGTTFACSVRVAGQARTVTVAVRSSKGQVEVGRPR